MSEYKSRLEGGGALSVRRAVSDGGRRWLCYTSFSDSECLWQISVSDGVQVWSIRLSESEVKRLAGGHLEAGFIRNVSHCLKDGDLEVLPAAPDLTLCLKSAPESLQLTLSELTGADCQLQLRSLIFDLWDHLETVQSQLAECLRKLEGSRQEAEHHDLVLVDASRSLKPGSSRAKRPAGASLVNPSMKRRKAVKGVVFGDSQD